MTDTLKAQNPKPEKKEPSLTLSQPKSWNTLGEVSKRITPAYKSDFYFDLSVPSNPEFTYRIQIGHTPPSYTFLGDGFEVY